jgi:hypothetical protein
MEFRVTLTDIVFITAVILNESEEQWEMKCFLPVLYQYPV